MIWITLDARVDFFKQCNAVTKINREFGSSVVVSGFVITVKNNTDESKVTDILNREGLKYTRSSSPPR